MHFRNQSSNFPFSSGIEAAGRNRGPGRPKGSRSPSRVQISHESFPHVPQNLWSQMSQLVSSFMGAVMGRLEVAYAEGIESQLVQLLDDCLPDLALALGRASMETLIAQERGFHGSNLDCDACDGCLKYQGDVKKLIKTRIGDIESKRAYYYGACGHSVCPLDLLLGVDGVHAVMPSLQETVAWLAASMSYPETVKLLQKLCPSKFSLKGVETITATAADQVREAQLEDDATSFNGHCMLGSLGPKEPMQEGVAILEVDGGFALVRDHTEASREFKLALLGQLVVGEGVNIDAKPGEFDRGITLVDKSFVGHFTDPDKFFSDVQTEYWRRGFHKFKILHAIFDGGKWILPRTKCIVEAGQELSLILDWFHADERVSDAANVLHGLSTDAAAEWRTRVRSDLWDGRLDDFFKALQQAVDNAKTPEASKTLREHYSYFLSRRELLRYKECRERGLPIGSGAIEGGIRFIGKDRLDRTGMRWKIAGAEDILQLRCIKYSDRWDELATRRAEHRRRLYTTVKAKWNKAA